MAHAGKLVKESMARELRDELGRRPNVVVTSLGTLHAVEADMLRKQLSVVKARMLMVKRTIGTKVLSGLGGNGHAAEWLTGSVALILAEEDAGPAAKILAQFAKSNEGKLTVRGGWIEGRALDAAEMTAFANLPSKLQLMAQLIGTIEAPITDLVWTLESICAEVVWVLEAASTKKQEGS
jgi:large subunit ribosomal protein L10